jgi:hypothetical protein
MASAILTPVFNWTKTLKFELFSSKIELQHGSMRGEGGS